MDVATDMSKAFASTGMELVIGNTTVVPGLGTLEMLTTEVTATTTVKVEGLLTARQFYIATYALKFCINPVLTVCTLASNIINVIVFCKMGGLRDGVTQNFLILSLSDGTWGVLAVVYNVSYILWKNGERGGDLGTVVFAMLASAAITLPMNVSMVTTVIIAVVRCCCVAMPLTVKHVITAGRQLTVIVISIALLSAAFLYVVTVYRVVWRFNPHINRSQYMIGPADDVLQKVAFNDIYRNVLFNACFVVALVCLIILVVALRRSSQFQKQATSSSAAAAADSAKEGKSSSSSSTSSSFSARDRQVIKTVALVLVMFTLCNLPSILWSALRQAIPEFVIFGRYERSSELLYMISETTGLINACTNIFIYYFYNTRYRTVFQELFAKKKK